MSDWKKNIKVLLKKRGLTQEELATKLGVTQGAIGHWLTGRRSIDVKSLEKVAAALDVPTATLFMSHEYVVAEKPAKYDFSNSFSNNLNANKSDSNRPVNLISWDKVAELHQSHTQDKAQSNQYFLCPVEHGSRTYALKVEGDSMANTSGKSYPENAIIFVDPDKNQQIKSGDQVIAMINGQKKATFKSYVEDGGRRFLKPLNPNYPLIKDKFTLLGKVLGMWVEG